MSRIGNGSTQRQRTRQNPLALGSFSETAVRYLQGKLGPENKLVGRADTNQTSNGGFGGGTYNHWFKIKLETPAWIIVAKGPPRPKYINVSAYDLNYDPIQGRGIFDADSVILNDDGTIYHPYVGHIMGAQSDLYNFYSPNRLDKGDDRYYPLEIGEYLLCISSTRNEPLDYAVALVIEVADPTPVILLEDFSRLLFEDVVREDFVLCDTTENYTGAETHEHSLTEWQAAWNRERQPGTPFPEVLVPLTTKP
jgi:hypothetical protein